MTERHRRRLKLMYLAGPQDPYRALELLRRGEPDPGALFKPYVRQFLELCDDIDAAGVVVSTRSPRSKTTIDGHVFYDLPHPLRSSRRAAAYHAGQILYGLIVWVLAIVKRPDVIIVCDGVIHYVTVPLLRLTGARIVYSFHNTLWACFSTRPDPWKRIARLCRGVLTRHTTAILSASVTISENIHDVTDGQHCPIYEFLPTYDRTVSDHVPNRRCQAMFRALYAGRIMPEKGAFAVIEMARSLLGRGCTDITFDLCGTGRAEPDLRGLIDLYNLKHIVRFHGQRAAAELRELYGACDVVVVPTTTDFREGFNQVVAEAVLTGRHVITSRVCPAIRYLGTSATVVEPDNVSAYVDALETLYRDRARPPATLDPNLHSRFFDHAYGWAAQARRAVLHEATPRAGPWSPAARPARGHQHSRPG